MNWKEAAAAVRWNICPFINGKYQASTSSEHFDNVNPATETVLCQIPVGSAADINRAVGVARSTFNAGCWSRLPPGRRAEKLFRLAELIVANKAELALLDTLEMGKPIRDSLFDTENFAIGFLRSWAGLADQLLGKSAPLIDGAVAINVYEPRGVVGAITPWNFPLVNAVIKFGPALAAGNAIVIKPSELASGSTLRLAELALEAGIPEGIVNVVPGLGSTVGTALASHPDVDLLSFTGSTATGRKVMELAARSNGKPVLLECGGKSPQVVFADIEDLEFLADDVVHHFTWNSGQWCSARTRLIVHERIKESLLQKVIDRTARIQAGDPLEEASAFGPLASPAQRDRVSRYIEQGLQAGAHAVLKGAIQETGGCYVLPTIFDHVEREMSIVREEIFGPVLCVQTFNTDEEALELANDTDYGLGATVWTQDSARGRRLAQAIRAGYVAVRTTGKEGPGAGCRLGHEPQRASGFGAEQGLEGLKSYSTLKLVHLSGL